MLKFLKAINPYDRTWKLFAINLLLAFFIMVLFWNGWHKGFKYFWLSLIWAYTVCFTQWAGHVYINNAVAKRYDWLTNTWKRIVIQTTLIVGYAVVAYIVVQLSMMKLINGRLPSDPVAWMLKSSLYAVLVSFGVSLIFTTVGFFKAWKKSLLDAQAFKREMLLYKYESLQNQINPHFLFNSFNVLSDLVYEDQEKAVFFIKKLSKLFRYVLDSRDKELVPINEELKFIESFAFLLQTRFEGKLTIDLNIQADASEMVVPMALQLLLENCVKHNEISTQRPLTVSVTRSENALAIKNNLQPKPVGPDSKKVGLQNLKQQYKYFTNQEVIITESSDFFTVQIPIIKA